MAISQNFSCNMKCDLIGKLKLDFWDHENEKDIFQQRSLFYNALIEAVIPEDYRKDACIAGGYFTKYKRDKFKDDDAYNQKVASQDVDIFVQYPSKQCFSPTLDELKTMLVTEQRDSEVVENKFQKGVFCTFQLKKTPIRVKIGEYVQDFNHPVSVSVMHTTCLELMRQFTFEPCKIAFAYGSKSLMLSIWFLNGGKVARAEGSKQAQQLKEKYKLKGLDNESDKKTYGKRPIVSFTLEEDTEQAENQQSGPDQGGPDQNGRPKEGKSKTRKRTSDMFQ